MRIRQFSNTNVPNNPNASQFWDRPFRELVCEHFAWRNDEYGQRLLLMTLHTPGRIVAPILRLAGSKLFEADIRLIDQLGRCRNFEEFNHEIDNALYELRRERSIWRKRFRLRVSGAKLSAVMRIVTPKTDSIH